MSQYRLVAEFERQSGVIVTWPHPYSDWEASLPAIEATYLTLVEAISRFEPILIICFNAEHQYHVRSRIKLTGIDTDRIHYCNIPTNDTWVRDYGPVSVTDHHQLMLLDFKFDGWNRKHPSANDNAMNGQLAASSLFEDITFSKQDFILEGGGFDFDGEVTLLTTSSALLSRNNPGERTKSAVESRLKSLLGIERILWLNHGQLEGDDTNGHIDTLARFCNASTIAYTQSQDSDDPCHADLYTMENELRDFQTISDQPYQLVPLPLPAPLFGSSGERLPANYTNFLIINGAVLVPAYDDPADTMAMENISACFPGREIISIDCRLLIAERGSLHCATMQLATGIPGFDG